MKSILNMLLIAILTLNFSNTALAICSYTPQIVDPLLQSWNWITYSELSGKCIGVIGETKDSKFWFAVRDGIMFYDGLSWEYYSINNLKPQELVTDACTANDNEIYLGL